jgi:hypothetical protein
LYDQTKFEVIVESEVNENKWLVNILN